MDLSTGKPAPCVCSKLPQVFTGATVIDIFIYFFKKQQEKTQKTPPLFNPSQLCKCSGLGTECCYFWRGSAQMTPNQDVFLENRAEQHEWWKEKMAFEAATGAVCEISQVTSARFSAGGNKPGLLNLEPLDQGSVPPKQSWLQDLRRSRSELLEPRYTNILVFHMKVPHLTEHELTRVKVPTVPAQELLGNGCQVLLMPWKVFCAPNAHKHPLTWADLLLLETGIH